jgi:Uma2 family endonuclease
VVLDQLPQPGQSLGVKTIVCGDPPPVLAELIAERQLRGLDRHDEIWDGDYHVAPYASLDHGHLQTELGRVLGPRVRRLGLRWLAGFNLGDRDNFRVPDGGATRQRSGAYAETALIVAEILSPSDETFLKFDFYFDHGVEELVVVDGARRRVRIWVRGETGLEESTASVLLDVTMAEVETEIDWP